MKEIYLDNSATTALSPAVREKMISVMENYGNPSSLHAAGVRAEAVVREAREAVALSLGVRAPKPGQIIFCASGSEADNLAILGSVYAKPRGRGGKIITTDSEHPAVENCMKRLEKDGFCVARIPTRGGVLDMERLRAELTGNTLLVSLMAVNNETGAAYDLKTAFSMVRELCPAAVTHTDAVQGYFKLRMTPASVGADLMTVSAHKIHGPKGVGALYVDSAILKRRALIPVIEGGGQEEGLRSGTENVIGIAGFGQAAKDGYGHLAANLSHLRGLREETVKRLSLMGLHINEPAGTVAPHIVSVTLPAVKSETMLHYLSAKGIYVSSGSACSSHSHRVSRVLTAFGLNDFDADCTLRISFSEYNTGEDVDALCAALDAGLSELVRIRN